MTVTPASLCLIQLSLAPMFSTDTQWKPMIIIYLVFMVVGGIWIFFDANERVGNGCVWGALAFAVPIIGIPLYYLSLLYWFFANRRGNRERDAERERMETQRKKFVMQGEIERQQFLDNAMKGGGTVFDPAAGMGRQQDGFKYFTDETAEELISSGEYSLARRHLHDLLEIARDEDDSLRIETYRYYLSTIPADLPGPGS